MKHLSNLLRKLTAVAAVGIALTSCNRAEYAMLPKTSSAYHGTQRATIIKPVPAEAPTVAEAVAVTPAEAPVAAPVVAPAAPAPVVAVPATKAVAAAPAAKAAPAPKLNFMQKALVQKLTKNADKLAAKAGIVKKSSETAATNRIDGKLRQGLILVLIGLLVGLFSGISSIFAVVGGIIVIIGVVLIILYLLDEV